MTDAGRAQRAAGRTLAIRYATGLAGGHLIGAVDAAAIVIPLRGQYANDAQAYFEPGSSVIAAIVLVLGTSAVAGAGVANLVPVVASGETDLRGRVESTALFTPG